MVNGKKIKISYNDQYLHIYKYIYEAEYEFKEKIKYIKLLEKHNIKIKYVFRLLMIWYHIKFKKCNYSENIENRIIISALNK